MFLLPLLALHLTSPVLTPPMGWNSYDCYSYAVTEDEVIANAEFMAEHLKKFGWNYVVVDYVWSVPKGDPGFAPNQDKDFHPRLNMDPYGRLLPDEARFPSAQNGQGFRGLADKIHKLGLKFGIHLMRGIPKQAVAANCPIEGTGFHASQAEDPNGRQCGWLNHMSPLNMKDPAGQAYLDSIFRLYASWKVDFVKVDDISDPYSAAEIEGYEKAIHECGRPMVLSLSPGPTHLENADHVSKHANMWRLLSDLWDEWKPLNEAFDKAAAWSPYRSPSHWPDLDMLPLGQLRLYGPWTGPPNTPSRLSAEEAKTMMTLWIISKSPMMFGGDLPKTDPATISLLTNADALTPYRDPDYWPRNVQNGDHPIWVSESKKSNVMYLAVFNREDKPATVSIDLSSIGAGGRNLYDLWSKNLVPNDGNMLSLPLPAHGCRYFKTLAR